MVKPILLSMSHQFTNALSQDLVLKQEHVLLTNLCEISIILYYLKNASVKQILTNTKYIVPELCERVKCQVH